MIDKVCRGHTFDAVRRGIGHLRWDSAGSSGVLSGVLGVTSRMMTERLMKRLVAPALEYQKMGLLGAEVEIAGGVFFHLPQRDKSVFRWSGKGVGPCREALLPLPP